MFESLESRMLLSRTWFVALAGSDGGPGTFAQPFHTIQRAASLAGAGDTVFIRGGVYHETVTPARSGAAGAPITFEPWGNERVLIDGADPVGGWSSYRGSIYSAAQGWDLGAGNNQVFVDWQAMNEARWPNSSMDASHPATAAVTSAYSGAPPMGYLYSDTATITASSLPGGPGAWNGATIHIGAGQDWVVQTGLVVNSGNGSLTFAYQHLTNYETPVAGNRFYLSGKFQALDAPGEWYRDPTSGRLYVWTGAGNSPAAHTVEAKRRLFAFELSGRSYITIRNIHLFAASIDTDASSAHDLMDGIVASYVSGANNNPIPWDGREDGASSGIILNGSYNTLRNSMIQYSTGDGVALSGSHNAVQNSTIHDVDSSGADFAAIDMTGSDQLVVGNTIFNTGRDGILDSTATSSRILYNTIHDIGIQTTDLGAIYDHGTTSAGTEIAHNTIYNVRTGGYGGDGIYLDNGSAGYVVHDNTIWNTNLAIKLNPPSYSNIVYNNTVNGSFTSGGSSPPGNPAASPRTYYGPGGTATTLLGTLGGFASAATGVNDLGQVVGSSRTGVSSPGFLYSGGNLRNLGTLGGGYGIANAINAAGQIAGAAYVPTGPRYAFLYSAGVMRNLGALPGDAGSSGLGINAYGQVAGVSYSHSGVGHAVLFSGGSIHALGTLGGSVSEAFGLNDHGSVVGEATTAGDFNAHAFLYNGSSLYDLGTLGGSSSYAFAVNNAGQIAGSSLIPGNGAFHAFLCYGGRMRDLGSLAGFRNSVATGIDAAGDVVGYAYNSDLSISHAFIYRNGKMTDLNSLFSGGTGWTLTSATGINNRNQIVGSASNSSQEQRAFLMTI